MLAISKKRNWFLSIVFFFGLGLLGLTGCETYENVGGGSAIGAGLGALVGAAVGDTAAGAAIGAGIGAVGGLAKDNMEIRQENRANQAQSNIRLRDLEVNAEIDRQIRILKAQGYTADKYVYSAVRGMDGGIIVNPIERSGVPKTEVYK